MPKLGQKSGNEEPVSAVARARALAYSKGGETSSQTATIEEPAPPVVIATPEEEVPISPPPLVASEPLPPWLKNFQMIPVDRIRPSIYQKRQPQAKNLQKDAQLEAQMRESHEQGRLHLDVKVMPDRDDPTFFNPSQGQHRRIEAARRIGIPELLCYVEEFDRQALSQETYWENSDFSRQGLSIIEEGLAFQQEMEDNPLLTQEGVAAFFKIPEPGGRDHVQRCLAAARAMPDVQSLVWEDPDRSTRVVGLLSQLDKIEDVVRKRAPIIQGFREKKLNVDQVGYAVQLVLQGKEFTLDETKPGVANPRTIGMYERSVAVRKLVDRTVSLIGNGMPDESSRSELQLARDRIDAILQR
jgi:hypothetical protein